MRVAAAEGRFHAEIATFRDLVLHVAAPITRGGRQVHLRIDRTWKYAEDITASERPTSPQVGGLHAPITRGKITNLTWRSSENYLKRLGGSLKQSTIASTQVTVS